MTTAIVYYSKHHGNTKKLLDAIAAADPSVVLIDVTAHPTADLSGYDRIGFASGIYYSSFAKQVISFAEEQLPEGKDVFIFDDMISSGGSMIDTAKQLKKMNARRVFVCCTFGIFTDGLEAFDDAYKEGYFDRIITTNLTYARPELLARPYYLQADMSKFLASIIDFSNHDVSMEMVQTPTEKIKKVLAYYNSIDGTVAD